MSAHALLNCLNELLKRDKMLDKPRNKFNKFNSAGAQMLDSFYHMTSKLNKNHIFGEKNVKILPFLRNVIMDIIMSRY